MARTLGRIDRRTWIIFGGYAAAFVLVALAQLLHLPPLIRFGAAVLALAGGAVAVSEATERLAVRLSPAATGVVQSTLGNLPELFLAIFALQAGLIEVVAAAMIDTFVEADINELGLNVIWVQEHDEVADVVAELATSPLVPGAA